VNTSRINTRLISGIIIVLLFGIALSIRAWLPFDQVFSGEWIKFTGIDAYYHMRIVDNLVHNFPHLISFDPYFIYPGGNWVGNIHFFDWLLAGIIWIIGLGSPSQHTIDVVGVYFPAVLGALTVIPVYFIGKELFGRWAGLLSAALLTVIPGEFLGRSILGFTDYHVAETLFTATAMLFLILAIKTSRERRLTFKHLRQRDWKTLSKPVIYSLLAGIFLGIYLITWGGALLFIFILALYFVIQFIIDHLRHESTDYLCLVGFTLFFIALLMFLPFIHSRILLPSLVIALLIPPVLSGISWLMTSKGIKPAYYPLTLLGLGLAGLGILYAAVPSLLNSMLHSFSVFAPQGVALTVSEMQGLLTPLVAGGNFFDTPAWDNFYISFFLSFISLGILIYLIIKHGGADKTLLVVWSLVILAAAIGQRRFAYYYAVNVALLTGYLSWQLIKLAISTKLGAKPAEIPGRAPEMSAESKPGERLWRSPITIRYINIALAGIAVFFLVFFPCIKPTAATARQAHFAPSNAWCASLTWLKENTPDPFGDPNFYYQRYEPPPPGADYEYPDSAYGVLAWWDYGYWITRIAHRIPNANPSQNPIPITHTAQFFLSQDEDSAREIIQELGSAYVVIDYATMTTKFWAIAEYAGMDESQFYDVYYVPQEDKLVPVRLFYPEYYRLLSTRLYNFDGKAVTPEFSIVITYEDKVSNGGTPYKQITDAEPFPSYQEAVAYAASQQSANYRIVSPSQFISPVPLETVRDYKLVYSANSTLVETDAGMVPQVKIFEYTGNGAR